MKDTLGTLFSPQVFPALLLGLSSNAFQEWFPKASTWIGWLSLFVLSVVTLVGIVLFATNRLVPRRFANLVYVISEHGNLAVIDHPHYGRVQPPGSRLGFVEPPHAVVTRVLKAELGLDSSQFELDPKPENPPYAHVEIVPPPFQVQIETNKHKLGVTEHYDFVYLARVKGEPKLESDFNPEWRSVTWLKDFAKHDIERAPFPDIIPTFEMLRARLGFKDKAES